MNDTAVMEKIEKLTAATPDRTLVNRDTLTKAGVIIKEITEQFRKDR